MTEELVGTCKEFYMAFYKKFTVIFIEAGEDSRKNFEHKVNFHQMLHFFDVLKRFGPSPLTWAKPFESDIGSIKQGNVAGPSGLWAMSRKKNISTAMMLRLNPNFVEDTQKKKLLESVRIIGNLMKKENDVIGNVENNKCLVLFYYVSEDDDKPFTIKQGEIIGIDFENREYIVQDINLSEVPSNFNLFEFSKVNNNNNEIPTTIVSAEQALYKAYSQKGKVCLQYISDIQ